MARVKIDEAALAGLLDRYAAAMADHERCLSALIDKVFEGEEITAVLTTAERRAQHELVAARERLLFALSQR